METIASEATISNSRNISTPSPSSLRKVKRARDRLRRQPNARRGSQVARPGIKMHSNSPSAWSARNARDDLKMVAILMQSTEALG
ncbi:MAG TPA: hypothetical protein VFV61_00770 [Pyrinomonadaceae bacterium]|nr:hypothetical protein [Pyrinomonadaceae bacterium]